MKLGGLKIRVATALALATPFGVAAPAAAVELIQNGGFEHAGFGGTGALGYYNVGTLPAADHVVPVDFNWTVPINNVDIVANGAFGAFLAGGGAYNLDLVGFGSTGGISQNIDTMAGQNYVVRIAYANNGGASLGTADVSFNGSSIGTLTSTYGWQIFTTSFVGIGGTAAFSITQSGGGGSSGGLFLDNISVSGVSISGGVPEPENWALLMGGFAAVGFAARRRRNAIVAA